MAQPAFQAEDVTLYLGDCRKLLAEMGDACVDHTITDPPYDERTHKGARYGGDGKAGSLIDFAPLQDLPGLTKELLRVTRRWVIAFTGVCMCGSWEQAAGAQWVRAGIWLKPDATPQFTGDRPAMGVDAIAIMHRPGKKRWNGGGKPAVWTCCIERKNRCHPTQKPLALMKQLILDFTDPGELVADWYAGSGTTAVACIETGRRFLGCELREDYHAAAVRRIENALRVRAAQPELFEQPQRVRTVKQLGLL